MFYLCTCIKIQRLSNGFFFISTNSLVFKENQWKKLFSYFTAFLKCTLDFIFLVKFTVLNNLILFKYI